MLELKIKRLEHFDPDLGLPFYATKEAAGADIRACFIDRKSFEIPAGKRVLIPTGLAFEIPVGYEVQVRPRSGLSLKTDLLIANSPGTIDSDYRGEIMIIMANMGSNHFTVNHGDRIAQIVLSPVHQAKIVEVDAISDSERGNQGFGSTGINKKV